MNFAFLKRELTYENQNRFADPRAMLTNPSTVNPFAGNR